MLVANVFFVKGVIMTNEKVQCHSFYDGSKHKTKDYYIQRIVSLVKCQSDDAELIRLVLHEMFGGLERIPSGDLGFYARRAKRDLDANPELRDLYRAVAA